MDPIKLRVETSGAAEAQKQLVGITKATDDAAKAGVESGRTAATEAVKSAEERTSALKKVARAAKESADAVVAEEQRATSALKTLRIGPDAGAEHVPYIQRTVPRGGSFLARDVNGAEMRAAEQAAAASKKAAAATAAEEAALKKLQQQAERTALAVERLALAKGKSAESATIMGDNAAARVLDGAAPGRVLWGARSGFAAEAAALKSIAADTADFTAKTTAAKGAVEGIVPSVKKWGAANADTLRSARGIAEAFLPNTLVSRVISMGGALLGVLGGLSAGALALGGAFTAVAAGGVYYFWRRMKDAEEAAKNLNERIEAQANAIERAGERYDDFKRAGIIMGDAAKAYEAVTRSSEGYAFSLEHMREASVSVAAAEQRRIALFERAAKATISLEFSRKIAAADTPEERRALETQRDSLLVGESTKADAARAKSAEAAAIREVTTGFSDQIEKGDKLREARDKFDLLTQDKERREADLRERVLPGLDLNARALDDEDPARRAILLDQNIASAKERTAELRRTINETGKEDWTKVSEADQAKLLSLTKMIGDLTTYKKLLAEIAAAESRADAAEKEHMKTREHFIELVAKMHEATETRRIVSMEGETESIRTSASSATAEKSLTQARIDRAREASAQSDAEGFAHKNWNFANTPGADFGIEGAEATAYDTKTAGLARNLRGYFDADKATPNELGETAAILTELIAIVKDSEAKRGQQSEYGQLLIRELPKMRSDIEQIRRMADANNRRANELRN